MKKFKVLVCVTNSESSRVAFRFACCRAQSLGAHVEVLHVIDDVSLQNPFVSESSKQQEIHKANLLLEDYVRLADSDGVKVKINCVIRVGIFEEVVSKFIISDAEIGMLVIGYSTEVSTKNRHSNLLINRLGHSLMIPMTIVPGNLTYQQISELTNS